MSRKVQDLTIATVPAKKVINDLSGEEEKRRQRLEAQQAARERDRLERERVEQEIANRTRAKQASQSRSDAARALSWKRGWQGERQTDEGYVYQYDPTVQVPTLNPNRKTGNVGSDSPSTKQQRREAETIAIREYFYSQEPVPERGSPRERWFSFTPEERQLAKKMAFDGYDENDEQMYSFAERMGNGYAPDGLGVIGEAYQSEIDSMAGRAVRALEDQYEREDNAERDEEIAAQDRKVLSQFNSDELEILFSSIGRGHPETVFLNNAYQNLGAGTWSEMRNLRDRLIEKAGGNDRIMELWETFSKDLNVGKAQTLQQAGEALSEKNPVLGYLGARAANYLSAVGSVGELIGNAFGIDRTGRYSTTDKNGYLAPVRGFAESADARNTQSIENKWQDSPLAQYLFSNVYNAAGQIGDNLLRNFAFGDFGLALMGTDSFNRSFNEAAEAGIDPARATVVSAIKGAAEVLTEKIPFDTAMKSLQGKAKIGDVLISLFGEVAGEELSELIGDTADEYILGKDSPYNQEVAGLILDKVSPDEADEAVSKEYKQKYLDILVETILSSVGTEAVQYGTQKATYGKYYDEKYGGSVADIIDQALENDPYNQEALRLKGRLDAGKDVSGMDVAGLADQNAQKTVQDAKDAIQYESRMRLEELGQTGDLLAVSKAISNLAEAGSMENLSKGDRETIQNSKYGTQVANELLGIGEQNSSESPNSSAEATEDATVSEMEAVDSKMENTDMESDSAGNDSMDSRNRDSAADGINRDPNVQENEKDARYGGGDAQESAQPTSDDDILQAGLGKMKLSNVARPVIENGLRLARDISAEDYTLGVQEAYRFGQNGMLADLSKGEFAGKLHPVIQNAAYNAGRIAGGKQIALDTALVRQRVKAGTQDKGVVLYDGDRSKLSDVQQASLKQLDVLAQVLQKDFHIFESTEEERAAGTPNAWYDAGDSSFHIDVNSGKDGGGALLFGASHELTHYVKDWSPAKFKVLQNFLFEKYGEHGVSVDDLIAKEYDFQKRQERNRNLSADELHDLATEEVVAKSMEKMLSDGNLAENLAELKKSDRSLWQKIKDYVSELARKIREVYKGLEPDSEEGRMVGRMKDSIEEIQKLFAEGLDDASRNEQAARERGAKAGRAEKNTTREGGVKMMARTKLSDVNQTFAQQIEDYKNGKIARDESLIVSGTPEVFQDIGFNSLPMTLNATHVDYALNNTKDFDHYLTEEGLLQLPEALKKPVAIISSKTKNGTSLVAMLDVRQNGKQVITAVVVDGFARQNGIFIDSNAITSAYGKNYSISRVLLDAINSENAGNSFSVYYLDAKKAARLLEDSRVPMPKRPTTLPNGVIHSITDQGSPVKPKLSSVTESRQFKRWFGDPKKVNRELVNADGTPKVFYHGTPNGGFTVFKGWQYFTQDKSYADVYQNQGASSNGYKQTADDPTIYEVYLAPKNVFDTRNPKERKIFMDEFYQQWGNGAPLSDRGLPDWTDGDDFIEFFEENGYDYDAILLDEGKTGGYGDDVKDRGISIAVRDPEAIKSATDNIGTFDRGNKDIRYQQRGTSRELKAAQRQNEKLQQELKDVKELLKLQGQVTGGKFMTKSSIAEEAKILMKRYNAAGDSKELASMLDDVYRYIASGDDLTMDGVFEAAEPAADWILRNTKQELDGYAKEVLGQMKGSRIKLDATQLQEAASQFGSMRDFRKSLSRAVTIGGEGATSLDSWWQSMAAQYPDIFDADTNAADMPVALSQAVDTLRSMNTDITDEFGEDAIRQGILQDVYDSYWDVSTLRTVADKYQKKIDALKGDHKARMDALKQDLAQKTAEQKAEKRKSIAEARKKYREDMRNQLLDMTDAYRESRGLANKAGDNIEGSDIELKKDFADYPYDQQKVIEGYEEAVDEDILEFIEQHDQGKTWKGQKIQIGSVSDRMAADVAREAGVSGKAGSKIYFSTSALEHIQKNHGANGLENKTMANPQDIARINFVLQNYDGCGDVDSTTTYLNRDGTPAKSMRFWKKINGTYFVVEAVPDGAKTWVVSAFMDKNRSAQTPDAQHADKRNVSPQKGHVRNESAYASNTSIDTQSRNVNGENIENSDNGTSVGAASSGFTNNAEYNALGQKYGIQPARSSDAVPTNVPNADRNGRKVSKFASNLLGSVITKDSTLPFLRELVKNGDFSYDPETNEQTYDKALEKLTGMTWEDAIRSIREFAIAGKTSAEKVVQAEVMMEYFMQMQNEDGEIGSEARRQLAEIASVSKMLSVNSGRALQAFKSFRKVHPAVATMMFKNDMRNTFDRLAQGNGFKVKNGGDITISDDLQTAYTDAFDALRKAKTDEERGKAKQKLGDIQDAAALEMAGQLKASAATKIRAWRYMSMLGNFKTQGRNVFGNAGMIPLREASRAMQGVLQKVLIQDASKRTVANVGFSEVDRTLLAWAKEDTKTQDIRDAFAYTGKLGEDATMQKYSALLRTFDNPLLEWVRTTTNKACKNGDILFKNREYTSAMAAWLKAQGITVQQIQSGEVSMEKLNEGRSYAIQQALIATFNDSNSFSDALANMKFKNPDNIVKKTINTFGEAIIPFRATPANVAVRAVEYSPIGLINGIGHLTDDIRNGNGTSAQTIEKVCNGMTGTALFAFGMLLANGFCGLKLHGPGEEPEDKNDGVQPWSVELPGGYIYDVSWLAPANMPLFMGVQIAKELEGQGFSMNGRTIWDVLNAGGELLEPILSLSCMSSLSDLLDSMTYAGTEERIWTLATQGATSYLGQFIPTLVRQVYNGSKEFKQSTYTNTENTLERKAQQFVGGIPWVGDLLGLRMDKMDEYGQPIRTNQAGSNNLLARELNSLIGLGKLTKRENDPLRAETKRLREDGAGNVKITLPGKTGASITQSGEWDGSKRYTKEEWIAIAKTQGTENQKIRDYIQSREYQAMSDSEKLKALKKLDNRASDVAREDHLWNAVQELDGTAKKTALDTLTGKNGEYKVMSQAMRDGVSFQDFREIASGYADRTDNKGASKMYGVIDSAASGKAIDTLLQSYMTESQQKKWNTMKSKGASTRDFVKAYEQVANDDNGKPGSTGMSKAEEDTRVSYFRSKTYITSSGKTEHYSESAALKIIHLMQAGFTEKDAIDYYHILK